MLQKLEEKGLTALKEVKAFCDAYARDPDDAVSKLGFDRKELMGRK